jgi:GH15 family glucan-1,4-alpha-glucosidase
MKLPMPGIRDDDGYAPIGTYGLIGDGHGCALVCQDGVIDWLAVPRTDTPPFLSAIIDAPGGGMFSVSPAVEHRSTRRYLPGTMILETTFETEQGTLRVTDGLTQGFQGRLPWSELARRIEVEGGAVPVRWELRPGTRFAEVRPWVHQRGEVPFVLSGDILAALVHHHVGDPVVDNGVVRASTTVEPGQTALLALVLAQQKPLRLPQPEDVLRRLEHSVQEWQDWSGLISYDGPHRDQVLRSALVIKALSSMETGAVAAAPTTSLPEVVGKSRNFDYRFGWVRDSSFMMDALTRLGLSEEVDASLSWLLEGVQRTAPAVHVFYRLDGEPAAGEQREKELLEGYKRSAPVMVGNKAAAQTQHGSYGDLLGAVSRYVDNGGRLDTETGLTLAKLVDQLCDEWPKPDAGLWELGQPRVYTSSLINSWAALDRAVRLAEGGEMPDIHLDRWKEARDQVHGFADRHCWSDAKQSYTFYAGTEDLDAAVLLAARTGFLQGDDRRLWTTIDAIRRELTAEGPLLYRYTGAGKEEHAFAACTFWMIEALSFAGRADEAGSLLEGALSYGNDLDLWSEEVDPTSGDLLGNFPIGISHLAVIGAITSYDSARQHGRTPSPR